MTPIVSCYQLQPAAEAHFQPGRTYWRTNLDSGEVYSVNFNDERAQLFVNREKRLKTSEGSAASRELYRPGVLALNRLTGGSIALTNHPLTTPYRKGPR